MPSHFIHPGLARYMGTGLTSQRVRDRLVERLRAQGIANENVLTAIRFTPRHIFVDDALFSRAYDNNPLPIGYGQTISQPYIVARMSEVLLAEAPQRVLEIGTGCGYQTAVLAQLVPEVYSIERIGALSKQAEQRLRDLGLSNITLCHGDGFLGWPQHSPFEAILVTAAPLQVPDALIGQLTIGGRLILPVGTALAQRLLCLTRTPNSYHEQWLDTVNFVPLKPGTA